MRAALLTVFFLYQTAFSQKTWQSWKIEWDSARKTNHVIDTASGYKFDIDYPFSSYPNGYFRHGLVYVRTGDMKGLMDLKGRKLVSPCHFINFNSKDSIISAYMCGYGWIFLNFKGDTVSFGRGDNNYCPALGKGMNPAYILDENRKVILWGYLDDKARWKITPRFEAAEEFINGKARVKIQGVWHFINENGKMIE